MRRLKRGRWRSSIAIVGILFLLILMVWVPASATGAGERASGLATSVTGTVQMTPTEDATVAALNKEKLAQEVQQLKNQNEPTFFDWLRGNVSILLLGLGALAGFLRWLAERRDARDKELKDRQAEREKRAEERFQSIVEGLGNEREEAQVGAAITLRTFLHPRYEQFYRQVFDLTVAHLRLPRRSVPLDGDPNTPLPLTSLRQALIVVFKEAFPLARSQNKGSPRSLDASRIQLDNAYLREADLKQVWLRQASLRNAILHRADLRGADLLEADLCEADLRRANLDGANLKRANIEDAELMEDTNLRGVKGLTTDQLETCKAKGAIIDEASTSSSSQLPISPSPPLQSNDSQSRSTLSAQGSTPTPDTDGSNAASSQQI